MILSAAEVPEAARLLWEKRQTEVSSLARVEAFRFSPDAGKVRLLPGAPASAVVIRDTSVLNVMPKIEDSFAAHLIVSGYRTATSGDLDPWTRVWQPCGFDSLQDSIHRPAVRYGWAYVVVAPSDSAEVPVRLLPRTPMHITGLYADESDRWAQLALEMGRTQTINGRPVLTAMVHDDAGTWLVRSEGDPQSGLPTTWAVVDRAEHGAGTVPVVRYVLRRGRGDKPEGKLAAAITPQCALNLANFDRLMVSHHGAFPGKYAVGWEETDRSKIAAAGMDQMAVFDQDPERLKLGQWQAAAIEGHTGLVSSLVESIAILVGVSPTELVAGSRMVNLSAEALAAVEAGQQREVRLMRTSLGESHEQLLRLAAAYLAVGVPQDAEITWENTEARSYASTVDAALKLVSAGVPIEQALMDVPGWTAQRIEAVRQAAGGRTASIVAQLERLAGATSSPAPDASPAA